MKNRLFLWLLLASQLLFLLSSLLEPPRSLVMIIVRVGVPLVLVSYIVFLLSGYNRSGKE
jgi:hypothetical protein